MLRFLLLGIITLVWILGLYIFGLMATFIFIPDFSTPSFFIFFLIFTSLGLLIGLLGSAPLIIWKVNSEFPWRIKWVLSVIVIFFSLLLTYGISGILGTGTLFAPFPQPPDASSSAYSFNVESGGLAWGPSIRTGFRFKWETNLPEESFTKAKNTARFFDEWAKKKGYKMVAFSDRIPLSCEEKANIEIENYKKEIEIGILEKHQEPYFQIYIYCWIRHYVPGVHQIRLTIRDRGGNIDFTH